MDAATPESSHGREPATDAPPLPPIVQLKIGLMPTRETDEGFRHWRLTNKANRASSRSSKYTGSSATFMKTKDRLSKSLDREATLAETFKYTHTLKENKEIFADKLSQDHYESYTKRLEAATQQGGEDTPDGSVVAVVDPNVVWRETTLALYKNRLYGIGSFFASSLRTSKLRPTLGSVTSRAIEPEKRLDLRLQVQELQRILQQQAQELNDYRERY
ncbi:hypothetical protein Ahy_A09g045674 [Arachis hypogaea]|uniref:Uncharacterized protein n=1 Tax=Arachis hypogaea TaxID=3818 RepID=A0A445BMZ0_ARAHY|nr:hypothetical protein Ahy_A09g045674 [Arachis hypogaea]